MKDKMSTIVAFSALAIFLSLDLRLLHSIRSLESTNQTTITVKYLMLDQINCYVMSPLSRLTEDSLHVSTRMLWLSPNHISLLGVLVAALAARLVMNDSLRVRRLAVVVFLLRQFLDDLDGLVARMRMGLNREKELSLVGTNGYVMDGLCDAIGFTLFLVAVFLQSKKSNKKYVLLTAVDGADSDGHLFRQHLLFGLQLLLSSLLWNRFIDAFHTLLESAPHTEIKLKIFKSYIQLALMLVWRVIGNAHQLMNFLLASVWFARSREFVQSVHVCGFFVLIGLSFVTQIHINDISTFLKHK